MQKRIYLILLVVVTLSCNNIKERSLTQYVDVFTGSGGNGWSEGRCIPGATLPFGMVQLSPVVRDNLQGYYRYDKNTIKGFGHMSLSGAGISEGQDFRVMPTIGELKLTPGTEKEIDEGYGSRFKKEKEKGEPGYYTVFLDDYNILAELTATKRVGVHRYTFPKSKAANIVFAGLQ
jgi:putative alpha-1,2-mannosidase